MWLSHVTSCHELWDASGGRPRDESPPPLPGPLTDGGRADWRPVRHPHTRVLDMFQPALEATCRQRSGPLVIKRATESVQ